MHHKKMLGAGILLLALAVIGLTAQTVKIRVKTPNAVLRVEPSASGEVAADKIAAGTTYDSERKVGAWYEIKHRSAIGVLLVAFINEADVELVTPAKPAARPEKPVVRPPVREPGLPSSLKPGLVLSLGAGLGMTSFDGGSTEYGRDWNWVLLQNVHEFGEILGSTKNPVSLGFGLGYFFSPNVGLQLRVDYQMKQDLGGESNYFVEGIFAGNPFAVEDQWSASGSFSVMPVSLDLVGRFALGSSLRVHLNAGVSYFLAKIEANTRIGFTDSWISGPYQLVDYYALPTRASKSLNGIGFNIGGSLELAVGRTMGLFLEAVYFLGPTKTEPWRVLPGVYIGPFNPTWNWTVDENVAALVKNNIGLGGLEVPLSFLKLGAGFKIGL